MKTQSKKIELPKVTIIPNDGTYNFLIGKDFFAEKNARAKEMLNKMKLPEGFESK
jgi:hypothetical protein